MAAVINLPGNFVLGGDGGMSMLAGLSRMFFFPLFVLTIAIAAAPVSTALLLFGAAFLSP